MWQTILRLGSVGALLGCGQQEGDNSVISKQAVASVTAQGTISKIAYTDATHADALVSVLDGEQPKDFHWVMVTFPTSASASGVNNLVTDLTNAESNVTFTQVYQGVCNPALDNYNECWLFERYEAGEPGLSGSLQLTVMSDRATGMFDIVWEGLTDRFGAPTQWHKHGTLASFDAPLVGGQ